MTSKVASSTATSRSAYGSVVRGADEIAPVRKTTESEASQDADLRLVIEDGAEPGQLIYTIIDRRTGRIVSRRARDEVLRLREDQSYAAGALIDSKA